ncbi:hypothetical protein TNCV_427391 [Trichonephila clavipes]|nr:hypothetical protein TNCV_427391 [Trichonephila clavipes]
MHMRHNVYGLLIHCEQTEKRADIKFYVKLDKSASDAVEEDQSSERPISSRTPEIVEEKRHICPHRKKSQVVIGCEEHSAKSVKVTSRDPAMFADGSHTPAGSGIPTGKSQVESGQTNGETYLTNMMACLLVRPQVKKYFVKEFGNPIIGYGGVEDWPPRSSNLTALDFFLWGLPEAAGVCDSSINIAGP